MSHHRAAGGEAPVRHVQAVLHDCAEGHRVQPRLAAHEDDTIIDKVKSAEWDAGAGIRSARAGGWRSRGRQGALQECCRCVTIDKNTNRSTMSGHALEGVCTIASGTTRNFTFVVNVHIVMSQGRIGDHGGDRVSARRGRAMLWRGSAQRVAGLAAAPARSCKLGEDRDGLLGCCLVEEHDAGLIFHRVHLATQHLNELGLVREHNRLRRGGAGAGAAAQVPLVDSCAVEGDINLLSATRGRLVVPKARRERRWRVERRLLAGSSATVGASQECAPERSPTTPSMALSAVRASAPWPGSERTLTLALAVASDRSMRSPVASSSSMPSIPT